MQRLEPDDKSLVNNFACKVIHQGHVVNNFGIFQLVECYQLLKSMVKPSDISPC